MSSPNIMECTWQGSSLSTSSYHPSCVLKKDAEGWGKCKGAEMWGGV